MRRIATGCALAALLAAGHARAGLPDWAKPIAASAAPIPEGSPEWPARVLLYERRVEVDPRGIWRVVERTAMQILSNRADDMMFGTFTFNDDTKVKKSKGWHVPPGEHAERNMGGSVDVAMGDAFLSDAKARAIALDGLKRGSLVFFEFEAEQKPYTSTETFMLGDPRRPVDVARIVVTAPPGWTLRHAWLRAKGPEPVHDATSWTFELAGWLPPKDEPLGVEPHDLTPRLVVGIDPPATPAPVVPPLADWDGFARWFQGLARGRDVADPAIAAAAKEAVAAAGAEPIDKIRAIALLVRNRVRYVSRAVGIGGYTPAYAKATLAGLYGDCKDKGTLYRAALSAAGFESYPILISATEADTVADAVPDPGAFDHFVVGVAWPKDAPVPEGLASALIEPPGLGKVLVVDTTDEYAWPGTLPASLAGHRGALVAGDRGILVTMPAGDPATHRIERSTVLTLGKDGGAGVTMEVRYFGWPAESARAEYAGSAVDRRESVEAEARRAWSGAEVKDYSSTIETKDGAYVETLKLDLPAGSAELSDGLLGIFAGTTGDVARVPLAKRKGPVVFEGPVRLSYTSSIVGAPEGGLPSGQEAVGDGWKVQSGVSRDGETVKGSLVYERARTRFDPEAFPEVKQMWSAVSKAGAAAISLHPH